MAPTTLPPESPRLSILMYHQVGRFDKPRSHRSGYCDVGRFRTQLAYLRYFGYSVVSLSQAYRGLFGGEPLPPRPVVLSFDDGYRNFHEYALPVLVRHRFPAVVFMITNLIGKRADWLATDGREAAPMMDAGMLRDIEREGIEIGSHTCNHVKLSEVEPETVRAEVSDSKAALEDLLGHAVPHFCYPYGKYDATARDAVRDAGYDSALTCIRGDANEADNPFEIPRKAISYGDSVIGYFWKLHMKRKRKL